MAEHLWQVVFIGIPLILLSIISTTSKERRLVYIFLFGSLLYSLYAIGYRTNDAVVFLLPGLLLLSLAAGAGMRRLSYGALLLPLLLLPLLRQQGI